jgi:hypothetical protein
MSSTRLCPQCTCSGHSGVCVCARARVCVHSGHIAHRAVMQSRVSDLAYDFQDYGKRRMHCERHAHACVLCQVDCAWMTTRGA